MQQRPSFEARTAGFAALRRVARRRGAARGAVRAGLAAALLAAAVGCSDRSAPPGSAQADPAALVEPFAGTDAVSSDFGTGGGAGNTYPGAVVPFGMLQWSPDTAPGKNNSAGGYTYADTQIRGFSLTHLSGAGCGIFQDVPLLPTVTPLERSPSLPKSYLVAPEFVPSFSHADEEAQPGSYRVRLDPGTERAIDVELAATTRSGVGRFTFPATDTATVLFNAGGSSMANGDAAFEIDPSRREVRGSVESGQFCYHRNRYRVYFVARFERDFASFGTWERQDLHPGATSAGDHADQPFQLRPISGVPGESTASNGAQAGAWVAFDARRDPVVGVRVGVSFVGVDGARANLDAESAARPLEEVRDAARASWNEILGRLRIEGGREADRRTFYTMLYHALLSPTTFSDADGRYVGMDGALHDAGSRVKYTSFSGWDVYRSQVPLLALVAPDVASDLAASLVADQRDSGWLPRWSVANAHTDVMVGDPAAPAIAAAYAFGARDFDHAAALAAMIKGGTDPGAPDAKHVERQGLGGYLAHGYVPHDGTEGSTGSATSMFGSPLAVWGSAATTLEYAVADFAVSRFAAALGDRATCRDFLARSASWANLWNPETGFIQPRYADGSWKPDFDPTSLDGYTEGDAAQYTWMIPHDVAGLAARMGGVPAAAHRLDEHTAEINAGPHSTHAFLGNEPEAVVPWLFAWLGAPEKTQAVVRRAVLELFSATPSGYPGNDDLGQMSAWWVFGALGFYPAVPGTDLLVLGSPLFPAATLDVAGRRIHVAAPDAAPDHPYVRRLTVGGRRHDRPWLRLSELADGTALAFDLQATPGSRWATDPAAAPPSFGASADPASACAARG